MQHDFPLTLQHVRDRMRTLYGDSEVVSVRDGERSRASYGEVVQRADRLASALAGLGVEPGDRVATFMWNTREHLEAYIAVPVHGRRSAHAERAPVPRAAHLHRQPRRGPRDRGGRFARARARGARSDVRDRRALHRRRGCGHRLAPRRAELRGAARRAERGLRLPRARRTPGCRPLLHERHHREPEGSRVLATARRTAPPLVAPVHGRLNGPARHDASCPWCRCSTRTPGASHTAPSPRRRPGHARRRPERRGAVHADHRGARHLLGGRAHHLDGRSALRRRAQARPVRHATRDLRRLGRASRSDAGARAEPWPTHHAGLGHDRDEPTRIGGAPARRRRRATSTGATGPRAGARLRWSRCASSTTTATRCRGTASPPASSRRAGRGCAVSTSTTTRRRGQVPRRLAAHRRHRGDRRARLLQDQRPREGRDQVGRRVDLVGRPGGGDHGPPRRAARPR